MPMKRELYPADWKAISDRIKFERAGGRCENCGVQHGKLIIRSSEDSARYVIVGENAGDCYYYTPDGKCLRDIPPEFDDSPDHCKRVILTTHHIGVDKPDGSPGDPADKMDCREENLAALCQRCHLEADRQNHLESRHRTWLKKKHGAVSEAGQLALFGD